MHTQCADAPAEDGLDGNTAGHADVKRHDGVVGWVAVGFEGGRDGLLVSVCVFQRLKEGQKESDTYLTLVSPLDDELVLQHHKVPLARLVAHEQLQPHAERIDEIRPTHPFVHASWKRQTS